MPPSPEKRPSRPPHHRKPVPPWLFPKASDAPDGDEIPAPVKPPEGHNGIRPPSPGPGDDDELDDDGGDDDDVLDEDGLPPFPDTIEAEVATLTSEQASSKGRSPTIAQYHDYSSQEAANKAAIEHMMALSKLQRPTVILIPAWARDAAPQVRERIVLAQLSYWLQPKLCLKGANYPSRSTARSTEQISDATGLKCSQVTTALRRLRNARWIGWYTRKMYGQRKRVLWLTSEGLDLERAGSEHRPIAYRPAFAQYLRRHITGKLQVDPCTAGLFLSQVYFWISSVMRSTGTKIESTTPAKLSQHYYITTLSEIADQIGISYPAARRSASVLHAMGLMEKTVVQRPGGDVGTKFQMTPTAWELTKGE